MSMSEKQQIHEVIVRIFAEMGFTVDPTIKEVLDESGTESECTFMIKTQTDAQCFIGHHGGNLRAIEHLAHVIARQKNIKKRFKIDVNEYKEGKSRMFERIAQEAAKTVTQTKKPVVLRPMSPYERRLIHTSLATNTSVTTDSIGEKEQRKVVVKPTSVIDAI